MLGRSQQDDASSSNPAMLDDHLPDDTSTMNVPATTDSGGGSNANDEQAAPQSENRTNGRGLSSASIDVLGTLLRYSDYKHVLRTADNF